MEKRAYLLLFPESLFFSKAPKAFCNQSFLRSLVRSRELCAPLAAAAHKDSPAVCGLHPRPESKLARAFDFAWLVCSFHVFAP